MRFPDQVVIMLHCLSLFYAFMKILMNLLELPHRLKTLAKSKTKVVNISFRGLHKFQARLSCKKRIENFHIWF